MKLGDKSTISYIAGFALVCFLLLASNVLGIGTYIKDIAGYYVEPVSYWANSAGQSFNEFWYSMFGAERIRKENERIIVENAQLKSANSLYLLCKEENQSLKTQSEYLSQDHQYIEAIMLKSGLGKKSNWTIINVGSSKNIAKNDVVTLGQYYVGLVTEVGESTSRIILPNASDVQLQVIVCPNQTSYEADKDIETEDCVRGVSAGDITGIKIENVPSNASISIGDVIIVSDERVSEYLVLGYVKNIISKENMPTMELDVDMPVNYVDLKYVYVMK